ncbi:uncharacterized [Tachysurus ichikawai]
MSVCLSSAGRAQRSEISPDSEVLPQPLRRPERSSFTSLLWAASAPIALCTGWQMILGPDTASSSRLRNENIFLCRMRQQFP